MLKKIMLCLGKGPPAVATVSLPNVIDSVDPKCLSMPRGVRYLWTSWNQQWGKDLEKYDELTRQLVGVDEDEREKHLDKYPCFWLVHSNGGMNMEEVKNDQNEQEQGPVTRKCDQTLWKIVKNHLKEMGKKLEEKEKQGQGTEVIEKIVEIWTSLKNEVDNGDIVDKMKKVQGIVKNSVGKLNKSFEWLEKEGYQWKIGKDGIYGKYNDWFDNRVIKEIDWTKLKNLRESKADGKAPAYCVSVPKSEKSPKNRNYVPKLRKN